MKTNYALQKLFEGVVPERVAEIDGLINKYSVQFQQVCDRDGFHMVGGALGEVGLIQYTYRSMQQLWLFGYAGLLSMHCYTTFIVLLKSSGIKLDMEKVKKIYGQEKAEKKFAVLLDKIREINKAASEGDYKWPEDIPTPEQGRQADAEQALVFDLSCMAAAYVFLHELRHAMFSTDGDVPPNPIDEEIACDAFAKEMMTSHIAEYSAQTGYPADAVKMKRFMGIALASAFLLFATERNRLKGSETHPAIYERWLSTIGDLELSTNDFLWLYFASLTLAILQNIGVPISNKKVESFRTLCLGLIEDLKKSI
jgi:hypothetical protein